VRVRVTRNECSDPAGQHEVDLAQLGEPEVEGPIDSAELVVVAATVVR
jgi:hypothetical protein